MKAAANTIEFAARCHPACVACRASADGGLGLKFQTEPDGAVVAPFTCAPKYQGYPDRLHGGVVATLLDAAMTHWLFSRGIQGYTGRLDVRYRSPVEVDREVVVRAWLAEERSPLYLLEAELLLDGKRAASAKAKFFGDEAKRPRDGETD